MASGTRKPRTIKRPVTSRARIGRARRPSNTIILATDGRPDANGTAELVEAIAARTGAGVRVVSVRDAGTPPIPSPIQPLLPIDIDPEDVDRSERVQMASVRRQLTRVKNAEGWPVDVLLPPIATAVAGAAEEHKATLIVTGRGRHDFLDRLLGEEHLVRLLHETKVPVLAAAPELRRVPKRVVICIDVAAPHDSLVERTLDIVDEDATVHLIHVIDETPFDIPTPSQIARTYEPDVRDALEKIAGTKGLQEKGAESVILRGPVADSVREFAETHRVDLIATGTHGRGAVGRLAMGSVAASLLRTAPCSVLVVPMPRKEAP
jgi:nucleotide-binding universal stress UspA family protein